MRLLCVVDRQVQLERGDPAAQELVNSLQVLEVMAGAMAAELRPLVGLRCVQVVGAQDIPKMFNYNCVLFLSPAAGAPPPSVHLSAAPVHRGASHGSALRGGLQ